MLSPGQDISHSMYKCWLLKKEYTAFLRTFNRAKPQLVKGRLMQQPHLHTWRCPPRGAGSWGTTEKWAFREFHRQFQSHFYPTNRPRSGGLPAISLSAHWSQVTQFRWHLGSGGGGLCRDDPMKHSMPRTFPGQILSQNCSVLTQSFSERRTQYVQHVLPSTPERKTRWPGSQQNVCFPFL